ncbi:MAG TPA: SMC-Scp complex subunit ScpB [Candidatus Paceibacterota bacterium]|nr:SMC-Scp complex subunit ScpB [Candidatus Paceibacterota bacterium]
MSDNAKTIEALLYAEAREFSIVELAKLLQISKEAVREALEELKKSLEEHGIVVVEQGEAVSLGSHPSAAKIIESLRKEMLSKELTKAAAETLAVILYHPGISKPEIEFIRGVNASYSIRLLQMRGLIEQKHKEGDARVAVYTATSEALQHFGITSAAELPEFAALSEQLGTLLAHDKKI